MSDASARLSWSDLAGRRIGLWGLGVEGTANLARAAELTDDLVLVDEARAGDTAAGRPVDGEAVGIDHLKACDVVVKSPGISRLRAEVAALIDAGVALTGGLGLWLADIDPGRAVCVTGTKGKSTASSVLAHLLRALGERAEVAGNIGVVPYDPDVPADVERFVVEVSSYQAVDVWRGSPLTLVTSLSPDHVEWHGTVEQYYADKLSLCTADGVELVVAPATDTELRAHASLMGPNVEWIEAGEVAAGLASALGLRGEHNARNVAIALAAIERLGHDPVASLGELTTAAETYEPLPSRLTSLGVIEGVTFYDDCLSTNALPTVAALEVFAGEPLVLIVGGADRGIDYAPLAEALAEREALTFVQALGEPDNGDRIFEAIRAVQPPKNIDYRVIGSLDEAVIGGYNWCRSRGGVAIVLSPAAPTRGHAASGATAVGRYDNYRAKSAAFSAAIAQLGTPA